MECHTRNVKNNGERSLCDKLFANFEDDSAVFVAKYSW